MGISPADPAAPAWTFSGGNQQKLVVGRWLSGGGQIRLLVLDEPTAGVDVGARADVYRSLRALAARGLAVLISSSEPEEMRSIADRVIVLHKGEAVGELAAGAINDHALLTLAHHSISGGALRRVCLLVDNALLLALGLLVLFFASQNDRFVSFDNFRLVALQVSIMGIVSVPLALLLISGGIDLSVGSIIGLGGMTSASLLDSGTPVTVAVLAGILAGAAVGVANGALSIFTKLSPIVVTLGALAAVRGLTFYISAVPIFGFPDSFTNLGSGRILGVPILVLIAAGVFVIGYVFLNRTPWGQHVYAFGVNSEAARLAGISTRVLPFMLYVATGAAAGLGDSLLVARLNSATPGTLGLAFEIDVLTAILLGGVAFGGGRGRLSGVLVGVVFLGVLSNGLVLLDVRSFTQTLLKGIALVAAAGLATLVGRLETRAALAARSAASVGEQGR